MQTCPLWLLSVGNPVSFDWPVQFSCLAHYLSPYFSAFLLQSDRLKQVKTKETARWDLVKGDHDCLIEVKITVIRGHTA